MVVTEYRSYPGQFKSLTSAEVWELSSVTPTLETTPPCYPPPCQEIVMLLMLEVLLLLLDLVPTAMYSARTGKFGDHMQSLCDAGL